jgi:hypothetical protein
MPGVLDERIEVKPTPPDPALLAVEREICRTPAMLTADPPSTSMLFIWTFSPAKSPLRPPLTKGGTGGFA